MTEYLIHILKENFDSNKDKNKNKSNSLEILIVLIHFDNHYIYIISCADTLIVVTEQLLVIAEEMVNFVKNIFVVQTE